MPKNRKKQVKGKGAESNSDDESINDNASIYSYRSDNGGGGNGGNGSIEDDSEDGGSFMSIEKHEEKLLQSLENAIEKSVQTRVEALQTICEILMHRYMPDFIEERKITISDIIEKSLRRGKGAEQGLAAQLASLYCLQMGSAAGGDEDIITKSIPQILLQTIQNKSVTFDARAKCCSALGLIYFFSVDDMSEIIRLMQQFETIYSASYLKGDKTPSTANADASAMHSAALNAWGLLLTLIPPGDFCMLMRDKNVPPSINNLIGMLESPHLDVRMTSGEIIALILETGRLHDEDFLDEYLTDIIEATKLLARDSNKFRAKRDRRTQKATFRDVLRYLESDVSPEILIRFGDESLEINSWSLHLQYTSLCAIMGPGMTSHLSENDLLRDILQLGAKITKPVGMLLNKQSKLERHLLNAAAFKARTLSRSKNRDKRTAVFT